MRRAIALIALAAAAAPAAASGAPRVMRGGQADLSAAAAAPEQLRRVEQERSGRRLVRRYRQRLGGLPVLGAETVVTDGPGTSGDLVVDSTQRLKAPPPARISERRARQIAVGATATTGRVAASLAVLPARAGPRVVWRVAYRSARAPRLIEVLVDARTAKVLRRRDLARTAAREARIFDTNAIVAGGDPQTLPVEGDDPAFDPLYRIVALQRLDNPSCLSGDYVLVDGPDRVDPPNPQPLSYCRENADFTVVPDPNDSTQTVPLGRSAEQFQAAMAYFHIDRAQNYLQTLGLDVNNRQIQVFPHASPDDNSFYVPDAADSGRGTISFGDGGVDDAEDGDVIVHEYGHAIQDNQVPGFGSSEQGSAMGEGFADYLAGAISETYQPAAAFGACFAEWDSVGLGLAGNPPCLRRTDRNLTLAQAQAGQGCSDPGDFTYCGGEAWAGALWAIRSEATDKGAADRRVIQSHESLTANSDIQAGALALIAAYAGDPAQARVRQILTRRGLLDTERLDDTPATATAFAVPATRTGFLARGRDNDDVLKVRLTKGRGVVLRLRGSGHDFDLRLLRPGTTSLDQPAAAVAQAETAGSNEDLAYRPTATGDFFVDVRAYQGQGTYALTSLVDSDSDTRPDSEDNCPSVFNPGQENADGDRFGDACDRFPDDPANDVDNDGLGATDDNCPTVPNRTQTDWDGDGRGDACDRSATAKLRRIKKTPHKLTFRVTFRPVMLGARSVTLRVERKRCRRCAYRRVATLKRGRDRGHGRVDFGVRVRGGYTYRFRATLTDRRILPASATARVRLH